MGKWIKANLVLVSGIVLPLILVGGFFVLNNIPRMVADPPEYDFLLVNYRYDYQHPVNYFLSFEVRDSKLDGRVVPGSARNAHVNRQYASLYRYIADDNTFEEIAYDLPENLENIQEAVPIDLNETGELILDKRKTSPDGYNFEFLGYRGRGGLLGEIFGMGRRYESKYVLRKDNTWFPLPTPSSDPSYHANDLHFIGWVVERTPEP